MGGTQGLYSRQGAGVGTRGQWLEDLWWPRKTGWLQVQVSFPRIMPSPTAPSSMVTCLQLSTFGPSASLLTTHSPALGTLEVDAGARPTGDPRMLTTKRTVPPV